MQAVIEQIISPTTNGAVPSSKMTKLAAAIDPTPAPGTPVKETPDAAPAEPKKEAPGESPAESKPEEKKEEGPSFAQRYAMLAKKEANIVRQQRELKAQKEELSKQKSTGPNYDDIRIKAQTDPLGVIKELLGISYEDLTKVVLADGKPVPDLEIKRLKQELEQFKTSLSDQAKKNAEDAKTQAETEKERLVTSFYADSQKYVTSRPDDYPLTIETSSADTVPRLIQEHYEYTKKQGKPYLMGVEEAAALWEKHLEELTEKASKKLEAKRAARAPVTPEAPKPIETKSAQTRSLSELTASTQPEQKSRLTEAEIFRRAKAAMGAAGRKGP